jgi:hypothetical protein
MIHKNHISMLFMPTGGAHQMDINLVKVFAGASLLALAGLEHVATAENIKAGWINVLKVILASIGCVCIFFLTASSTSSVSLSYGLAVGAFVAALFIGHITGKLEQRKNTGNTNPQ